MTAAQTRPTSFWKEADMRKLELPADIENLRNEVSIEEHRKIVAGVDVFYQTAEPLSGVAVTKKHVFLLHGAAFTSQTWVDKVPTIATLSALGHKVTAIDLPGFGKTNGGVRDRGEFLAQAIQELAGGDKVVIVTPSMSGGFILPMLQNNNKKDLILGWVPVAPVGTDKPPLTFYQNLELPTMIVYGEKDTGLGYSSRDQLINIPSSTEPQVLPESGHPAYLDQPQLWHQLLHNFLTYL